MDRPRIRPSRWPALATPVMIGLGGLTTVTALSTWLLLTDPVVAAVGSLMPLVEAIVDTLRSALADLLAYL